jgi:hypothetical protein
MLMEGLEDSPMEEAIGVLAGLTPAEDSLDVAEPEENLPGGDLPLQPPSRCIPSPPSEYPPPPLDLLLQRVPIFKNPISGDSPRPRLCPATGLRRRQ